MRRVLPAFIAALLLGGGLAFAYPHMAEHWKAARVTPPPCPTVIGAEPVKMLPCLPRTVRGLPPPKEAAEAGPASRAEP